MAGMPTAGVASIMAVVTSSVVQAMSWACVTVGTGAISVVPVVTTVMRATGRITVSREPVATVLTVTHGLRPELLAVLVPRVRVYPTAVFLPRRVARVPQAPLVVPVPIVAFQLQAAARLLCAARLAAAAVPLQQFPPRPVRPRLCRARLGAAAVPLQQFPPRLVRPRLCQARLAAAVAPARLVAAPQAVRRVAPSREAALVEADNSRRK